MYRLHQRSFGPYELTLYFNIAPFLTTFLSSRFMQKIRPDLMSKYKPTDQAAKQRENISFFNAACAAMGVPETDLFQTIDLFEGKDPAAISNTLSRLGGVVSHFKRAVNCLPQQITD